MRPRLDALTATRGIAALMVVIYHYGEGVPPFSYAWALFGRGGLAVSYFFVLSGFVMAWGYSGAGTSAQQFWWQRMIRIGPLYWLLLLLFGLQEAARYLLLHQPLRMTFLRDWAVDFFFLQSWYTPAMDGINMPSWSLGPEVFFYLLFPLLAGSWQRRPARFLYMAAGLFLLSQALHQYLQYHIPGKTWYDINYANPLLRLNEFLLGMAAARLAIRWNARGIGFNTLPVFVLLVLLVCLGNWHYSLQFGLLAPLFALLVTGLSLREARWLAWRPLQVAGNASYGIYLLQAPVFVLLSKLNMKLQLGPVPFFYGSLLLLVFTGCCSYYLFELPVQRALRRWGSRGERKAGA